nr:uncharacterized mitochondrial protein AtMg00810-like [Tanacetum cinerariifolium]
MVRLEPETSPRIPPQGYPWWPTELAQLGFYDTIESAIFTQYVVNGVIIEGVFTTDFPWKHLKSPYGYVMSYGRSMLFLQATSIDWAEMFDNDPDGEDMDVHLYRPMIGSLMYLTSSRPDIMYLKGKPHLGLLYPKDSPFNLVAYSDSDYAGASLDRKSTTGGCQFLGVNTPRCDEDSLELTELMVFMDVIKRHLCLDDVDGVECLPKEEIFVELARMGYEKPPPKLTFYKELFSA